MREAPGPPLGLLTKLSLPAGNRVLTGETARLDLSGEEPPAEAYPFKYAIGMYDPQKGRSPKP